MAVLADRLPDLDARMTLAGTSPTGAIVVGALDELPAELHRRHRILSWLYSNALGLVLAALFVASFSLHWWASYVAANEEAARHGGEQLSFGAYILDAQLWFESFQNWQSEFLSTAVLVVLSIFLRHQGSPESKPVAASNAETGA